MKESTLGVSTDNKVYCLTFPNGKRYIGVTNSDMGLRLKQHKKAKTVAGRAVRKYGIDNISTSIVMDGMDRDSAHRLEIGLIALLRTQDSDLGYNISDGGGSAIARPKLDIERAIELYNSGESLNKIAKAIGTNHPTLTKYLSNSGLNRVDRPRHPIPQKINNEELVELRGDGGTIYEIGEILGVSPWVVAKRLVSLGMGGSRSL